MASSAALSTPAAETPEILYFFDVAHAEERARLKLNSGLREIDGTGLALSGGGIRSASFALGVVQVLLNERALSRIDYLSTVSGGGYLGSAISWWLHEAAVAANKRKFLPIKDADSTYEAFRRQFGSKVTGSRTPAPADAAWDRSNWLAYIRQHGNYLQPRGVGFASLFASVLRVCLYPLFVYAAALVGLFAEIRALETYTHLPDLLELAGILMAVLPTALLVAMSWFYGPATWVASQFQVSVFPWLYRRRTSFRRYSGALLSFIFLGMLIASVPLLYEAAHSFEWHIGTLVSSSLSLGTLGTIYQFFKGRAESKTPSWLAHVRLIATAGLLIYGLLIATYASAAALPYPRQTGLAALLFAAFFGLMVDTNLAGLARLYRDRLMEAFLPDVEAVGDNEWTLATRANLQEVSKLRGRVGHRKSVSQVSGNATLQVETLDLALDIECQRPLHILNCNVVLMDSKNDLYRNRGGDSFIITQLYSGSNATGWIPTRRLGDGAMTLATAMSISGAAANPGAGPNGLGITRNRLVSFLMSLFNVRLGFWMANPGHKHTRLSNKPNFWFPGFRQGLLGSGLSEKASFVELTDGGHFDNTAIYELVRRRTKLIIVAQAGCDPKTTMEDLANAIEKVRVDFSVFIEFDDDRYNLDALRAENDKPFSLSTRGYAIGRIRYPKGTPTSPEFDDGIIVYLQAVTAPLPADIFSYWRRHADFPNDTTADQFFTEENLEAYRELGYAIAGQLYKDLRAHDALLRGKPAPSKDPCPRLTEIAKQLLISPPMS